MAILITICQWIVKIIKIICFVEKIKNMFGKKSNNDSEILEQLEKENKISEEATEQAELEIGKAKNKNEEIQQVVDDIHLPDASSLQRVSSELNQAASRTNSKLRNEYSTKPSADHTGNK